MHPEPGIAVANRSVMHIVIEARDDEAHGWQLREVTRELTQTSFCRAGVGERFPWIMPAWRAGLDIADKAFPRCGECAGEIRRIERILPVIVCALSRSTKQREIIRLAWTRDAEGVDEQSPARCQAIDERRTLSIDDLFERMVLKYNYDDVVRLRRVSADGVGRLDRKQQHGRGQCRGYPMNDGRINANADGCRGHVSNVAARN